MTIINLADRRPHMRGEARCLQCKHEWNAVAPVGAVWLECPECNTNQGVMKNTVIREDYLHYECNCGNDLFYRTPDGDYCPKCGSWCN